MNDRNNNRLLFTAVIFAVLALLQSVLLTRYIDRLPGDSLGIWLNSITIVLFLFASLKLFLSWRSGKREDTNGSNE